MTLSRRRILVAAACATALVTLTACSGDGGDSGETGGGSAAEDITIHISLGGAADNHDLDPDNVIANGLEEAIGAQVIHEPSPEDLSASLAAGDSPDLFRVTRNQLSAYVEQGLVLDLTPYIDDLDDYVAYVGQDAMDLGMLDGELRAITPYLNDTNDSTYWIRQDWLDNLGLATPTTLEEFREVLRAFTEDDPDGNGQNDTYGLTGASPTNTFAPLWGSFGTAGPNRIYVDDDGEVRAGYEDEGMGDAIEYIADLQTSGFIDPDSYTLEALEARDRGFQGTAGVMAQSWTAVVKEQAAELAVAANPDANWQQLDLFPTADGDPGSIAVSSDGAKMYAIPATLAGDEAKIQRIIDLINYVSSPEGNRFVSYGVEGTHYELNDAGEIVPLPAMDEEGGTFFVYQVTGREEVPYLQAKFPDQRPYFERAHAQPRVVVWESYIISPEGFNQADAQRFADDQMVQFLTGALPASEYGTFLDTLNDQFGYAGFVDAAREQLVDAGVAG